MKKQKYLSQIIKIDETLNHLEHQLNRTGWLRIGAFLLGIASIITGFESKNNLYYMIGILLLLGFTGLVKYYNKLKEQKQYETAKKEVVESYVKRLSQEWLTFKEDGQAYINQDIPRTRDLDLLGKGSLFQYICVGHTPYGKEALAKALVQGVEEEQIIKRQEAIKELVADEAFARHLQTLSKMIGKNEEGVDQETMEAFMTIAEGEGKKQGIVLKSLALLLPFIALFSIVLIVMHRQTAISNLLGGIAILGQLGLSTFYYREHNLLFEPILKFSKNIKAYEAFLYALENKSFQSSYLKDLQKSLCEQGGPIKALKGLNQLAEVLKVRFNGLGYMLLGSILMWDFHCVDAYYTWHKQYGKSTRKWLKVMGEIEALLSLAVVCEVKEDYIFPQIEKVKEPFVHFSTLKHPLIQEQKAVGNALQLGNETCIITGSNMSGKTTFLRTIGINLALAYAGGPVLATSFAAARMEVLTSMRIEDNVNKGISTFYAELLRIKEMITLVEMKQPMLVLIDEIFKGTNSADRILGAKETIHALEKPWMSVMVSTHDFELCELEKNNQRKVYNYHFTEYYKNNQIQFDYELKKGRCKTTNAQYLLKMVGIIK